MRISVSSVKVFETSIPVPLTVPFHGLPRLYQFKHESGVVEELLVLGEVTETVADNGVVVLMSSQCQQHALFDSFTIIQYGKLRAVFDAAMKLQLYDFEVTGFDLDLDHSVIHSDLQRLVQALSARSAVLNNLAAGLSTPGPGPGGGGGPGPAPMVPDAGALLREAQMVVQQTATALRAYGNRLEGYLSSEWNYIQRVLQHMQMADAYRGMAPDMMMMVDTAAAQRPGLSGARPGALPGPSLALTAGATPGAWGDPAQAASGPTSPGSTLADRVPRLLQQVGMGAGPQQQHQQHQQHQQATGLLLLQQAQQQQQQHQQAALLQRNPSGAGTGTGVPTPSGSNSGFVLSAPVGSSTAAMMGSELAACAGTAGPRSGSGAMPGLMGGQGMQAGIPTQAQQQQQQAQQQDDLRQLSLGRMQPLAQQVQAQQQSFQQQQQQHLNPPAMSLQQQSPFSSGAGIGRGPPSSSGGGTEASSATALPTIMQGFQVLMGGMPSGAGTPGLDGMQMAGGAANAAGGSSSTTRPSWEDLVWMGLSNGSACGGGAGVADVSGMLPSVAAAGGVSAAGGSSNDGAGRGFAMQGALEMAGMDVGGGPNSSGLAAADTGATMGLPPPPSPALPTGPGSIGHPTGDWGSWAGAGAGGC